MVKFAPPSPAQLEKLLQEFRRDRAKGYLALGEAYLALERPRDAINVASEGLRANPNHAAGRLMVGRAFMMLRQWKQARAEFLKIVKHDKDNAKASMLLGEVLLRLQDYDQALPVLQHAQNLAPADRDILVLIQHARTREPLPSSDSATKSATPGRKRELSFLDEEPTRVADPTVMEKLQSSSEEDTEETSSIIVDSSLQKEVPPTQLPPRPRPMPPPPGGGPRQPPRAPPENVRAPVPVNVDESFPRTRPRVLAVNKPKDAAHAPLREAAAVGEDYLKQLLSQGLLNISNIDIASSGFKESSQAHWRKKAIRFLLVLGAMLGVVGAGMTGWYFWDKSETKKQVSRELAIVGTSLTTGTLDDLQKAVQAAQRARVRDGDNVLATGTAAQVAALAAMLYGIEVDGAAELLQQASTMEPEPAEGGREGLLAQVAWLLAGNKQPVRDSLVTLRERLEAWHQSHSQDALAQWMLGRVLLAVGERKLAKSHWQQIHDTGVGPVWATVELADVMADEGQWAEAEKLYDVALARAANHSFALLGKVFVWAEQSDKVVRAKEVLNVELSKVDSPRVVTYRKLAWAYSSYPLEFYEQFLENLNTVQVLPEARLLARLAFGHVLAGQWKQAKETRDQIVGFVPKGGQPDPMIALVDAELLAAAGKTREALQLLDGEPFPSIRCVRADVLRGRLLLRLGKVQQASKQFAHALDLAPSDRYAQIWQHVAGMIGNYDTNPTAFERANEQLDKLRRSTKTNVVSYAQGFAVAQTRDQERAKKLLTKSVTELTMEFPNPLAYRAYIELARLASMQKNRPEAREHLGRAREINPLYVSRGALGPIPMERIKPSDPMRVLRSAVKTGNASVEQELDFAEAIISRDNVSEKELQQAQQAIRRAKDKGASGTRFEKLAWEVDPAFAKQQGIPER